MKSLFLNGTVGVGKSTTAEHLSERLAARSIPHAVVDMDSLRQFWPAHRNDPFNMEVELLNLADLAVNFECAGAQCLLMAGVIESAESLVRYRSALRDVPVFVCRLTASPETLHQRLRVRHASDPKALYWHLQRSAELSLILRDADVDDVVIDSTGSSPHETADWVLDAVGWNDSPFQRE